MGHGLFTPLKGDGLLIEGKPIETRPEFTGKRFKPIQAFLLLEDGGVAL